MNGELTLKYIAIAAFHDIPPTLPLTFLTDPAPLSWPFPFSHDPAPLSWPFPLSHDPAPLSWPFPFSHDPAPLSWPFPFSHDPALFLLCLSELRELCESRGGRPGLPTLINLRFLWMESNTSTLSPFLTGRMFVREPSWKYSANLVGS